ncbi:hypothetical protein [Ruegeria lacuscaerulensis]|uniref:hypothetical protein n=1 Tax=Ruegeria lacuscaerulensis TaxID=55218 RepID=UPI00147FFA15|nr:hypothetical protein [Ruegeria lacuscaerulensis]
MSRKGHYAGGSTIIRTNRHLQGGKSKKRYVGIWHEQVPKDPSQFEGRSFVVTAEEAKIEKKKTRNIKKAKNKKKKEDLLERRERVLKKRLAKHENDPDYAEKVERVQKAANRAMQGVEVEIKSKVGKRPKQEGKA